MSAPLPEPAADIAALLRAQAAEIAGAGHAGWGNTMQGAAAEIERLHAHAAAAVAVERERCAQICFNAQGRGGNYETGAECAEMILAPDVRAYRAGAA